MTAVVTVQVCPPISELSEVLNSIPCPQGCSSSFSNTSSLEMHLIKTHNKPSCYLDKKAENVNFQYFCPITLCKYALNEERDVSELRWFSKLKYLKQHYLLVHKEKDIKCDQCQRLFSAEKDLKAHQEFECGKKFHCTECPFSYGSYKSLLNHCKRKGHNPEANPRPAKVTKRESQVSSSLSKLGRQGPILPKPMSSVDIAAAALSELSRKVLVRGVDKGVQTHPKRRATPLRCLKRRSSQQTQTGDRKPKIEAETQTMQKVPSKHRRTSMQTQTLVQAPDPLFSDLSNSSAGMEDFILSPFRNESGTQTSPDLLSLLDDSLFSSPPISTSNFDRLIQQSTVFDETRSCHIETQTDLDNLIEDGDPLLSNTETQTATEPTLQVDEYSHNCTQTCDDTFLTDLVEFTDIETQTGWARLSDLVSAETQTVF